MSKQWEPTIVSPKALVPRLIVTYSRTIVLFPILVTVFSPVNFKSWGISPIEELAKKTFFNEVEKKQHEATLQIQPLHDPENKIIKS